MTRDPLSDDSLRQALEGEPLPLPSPEAREKALTAALAAFDRQVEKKSQGFPSPLRLFHRVRQFFNPMGDWTMNQRTLAALATATLGMMLTLAVWHQEGSRLSETPPLQSAPEPAPEPAPPPGPQAAPPKPKAESRAIPASPASPPEESPKPEPAPPVTAALPVPMDQLTLSAGEADAPRDEEEGFAAQVLPQAHPMPPSATTDSAAARMAPERDATSGGATFTREARKTEEPAAPPPPRLEERDRFPQVEANPVHVTAEEPVSTFSVDVDTASYGFVRRQLNAGRLPAPDAVRVEEMINYFDYDYALPKEASQPFAATVSLHSTPWNAQTRLLHIGIRGFALKADKRPRANLVFLLDTSGSMNEPDKLPLLKRSLSLLVESLDPKDTVGIVVYAGSAGVALPPTEAKEKVKILSALDQLEAGGSTAGGEGIQLAYALAQNHFDAKAVNRVILATDGDFNVGVSDPRALRAMVAEKRQSGVFLSVLGFGQGNYHDRLMQELAQNGNGQALYIDTLSEARKALVEEAASTLFPIAKDVKIQVEFNPDRVAEYRLIGYETRALAREDFNNDRVDAGDIGSGHTVTALYEIVPAGGSGRLVEPLRYQTAPKQAPTPSEEWAFLKIRYKLPGEEESRLITQPVGDAQVVKDPSEDARFAAAVAAFGQRLQGGKHLGAFGFDQIIELARHAKGEDPFGHRAEFVELVRMAKTLAGR